MISYALIYKQIEKFINSKITNEKVIIGFVRRDSMNEEEMTTYPYILCENEILVNPIDLSIKYDDADLRLCIPFSRNIEIRNKQITHLANIKSLFEADLKIDSPYFWSVLIVEQDRCSLFALDLISIEFLSNNNSVSIVCKALLD